MSSRLAWEPVCYSGVRALCGIRVTLWIEVPRASVRSREASAPKKDQVMVMVRAKVRVTGQG